MTTADPDDPPLSPPTQGRVLRRAFCLCAVICRSFIDEPDNEQCADILSRAKSWLEDVGALSELEAWESECLDAPLGSLDPQTRVNASWTSEGLTVLAWALGILDLPAHDTCQDPQVVSAEFDFLHSEASELFESLELKSGAEIQKGADQAFALHWRLRQFSLKHEAMNLAEFAPTAWFGPLNIDGVPLVDGDLAIAGKAISQTPAEQVQMATSITMERHRAFNWLLGYDPVYSEVDTST